MKYLTQRQKSILMETWSNYVSDIIISLANGGFKKILVLNGHGTNEAFFPPIRDKVEKRTGGDVDLLNEC